MIRALFAALGPNHRGPLRALLALLSVGAVLQGLAFAAMVPVVTRLLGPEPAAAWPHVALLAAACVAWFVVMWFGQSQAFSVGSRLANVLHHRLGDAVVALPLGWFTRARVGEVARLASQTVPQTMSVPAHLLRPAVTAVLTPLTVVVVLFFIDVGIATAVLVSVPVLALVLLASNRAVRAADAGRHEVLDAAANRLLEFAAAQPVLRASGRLEHGHRLLDDALVDQRDADRRLIAKAVPGLVTFEFAVRAVFTAVLFLGVHAAIGGQLSVDTLVVALVLAARFVESISSAAALGAGMRMATTGLLALNRVLAEPPLPEPAEPRRPDRHDVRFEDVHFAYAEQPVLRGVGFTLPARGLTALVGPSGAGKSTVARLIARFWDPDRGRVLIGGVDLRDIANADLHALVSVVFQDVYLMEGTLADNIRVGGPNATDAEVEEAARLAGLGDVIDTLGLRAQVGQGGSLLSGGQRQRVSIARALLKNAPIVILDEATSALDAENDRLVTDAVRALAERSSVLVIAHRLHTVRHADQILVLRDGALVEQGVHDDLVSAGGTYATLWRQRTEAAGWRLTPAR